MLLLPIVVGGVLIYSLLCDLHDDLHDLENEPEQYANNMEVLEINPEPDSYHLIENNETIKEEIDTELNPEEVTEEATEEVTEDNNKDTIKVIERDTVKDIAAKRISSTEILIMWNSISDDEPAERGQYIVMRKGISANTAPNEWEELGVVQTNAESVKDDVYEYEFTDVLTMSDPVQYEYRIDMKTTDDTLYTGAEGSTTVSSNVLICIDPGHYKGASTASGENMYGYEEGIFTLQVGLALREELAEHGIDSYMTRETDSITIVNYTNSALDRGHISLRGEYAKGSSLFLSIHTNANKNNVNECDTWQQPLEINKTLVIVNQIASRSEQMITIANEIGAAVTATSYRLGLSFTDQFEQTDLTSLKQWTSDFNDSINVEGTVCYRWGTDGDYYGVLRGAANAGVPGMIIEHGYHTVEEMRRQAMTENLAAEWAKSDADGIANGLGFE